MKPGTVTIAGRPSKDLSPATWEQHPETGGPEQRSIIVKYTVVIEETDNGYSAYAPDVPGCVAAGDTVPEVEDLIREALVLHLESLREHGEPVPEPRASAALVEV